MSDHPVAPSPGPTPPDPPPDTENPALIDAEKTFKVTVVSAILFCLSAFLIIMSTRMGG